MLSVYGYYENGVCIPTETLALENRQQVIITVIDANVSKSVKSVSKAERIDVLNSLSGILPSSITDEDVKMCRISK